MRSLSGTTSNRLEWSAGDGYTAGWAMESVVGYPGAQCPTYRVTTAPDDQPITPLRLHFPANSAVDVKQIRMHELDVD